MNRLLASALCLALASTASADLVTTDFEDWHSTVNSSTNPHPGYINNSAASFFSNPAPAGYFESGGNLFNNSYEYFPTYDLETWNGWSLSTMTNGAGPVVGDDWNYEYSAVPGSGSGGSATYAVGFTSGTGGAYINLADGSTPVSIDVTNTLYDTDVIENGNRFTNPLPKGGFFLLTVTGKTGLDGSGASVGSPVSFYLANYQGSNSFLLKSWQTLNLTSLAGSKSLTFALSSSDNDPIYGMNTPALFAADNLVTSVTAVPEPTSLFLSLAGFSVLVATRLRAGLPGMMRASEGRDS